MTDVGRGCREGLVSVNLKELQTTLDASVIVSRTWMHQVGKDHALFNSLHKLNVPLRTEGVETTLTTQDANRRGYAVKCVEMLFRVSFSTLN